MSDQRCSDSDQTKRDIPSFIEPRPPLILNPFMRPRPQKGTNLLELFEENSESEEIEWVQVYLRIKPSSDRNNLYEVLRSEKCLVTSLDSTTMGHGRRTQHNVRKMYTFSHIFRPDADQKEIFEHIVKGNLKKLPEGHNFTLLTYGASGSGKTYTLMGTVQSPGLVPRSLEYVFRIVEAAQNPLFKPADSGAEKLSYYDQDYELQFVENLRRVSAPLRLRNKYRRMSCKLLKDMTTSTIDLSNRTRYYVWVSFIEIYNEAIYDLLSNCDRSKATSKLRIREDSSGNAYVKGARQVFVRSGEEAYDVLVAGKHNLQVAATGVHANSSRSHSIFTITMLTETDDGVKTSCVRLCDLAGSERARQTKNTGTRMQESRSINSSLHVLERCLHMLRRKQSQKIDTTLVPYRESKLTRLLGAGLCGARGESVSMVVTLNPAPQYAHETKHVLQLAAVAKDIRCEVNQTIPESILESTQDTTDSYDVETELLRLKADNERLHFELVQAESRNRELQAIMEEKHQQMGDLMRECVEDAKQISREYYETQLRWLEEQKDKMQEDYEEKLRNATMCANLRSSWADVGTPTRIANNKISQLMTELAILKEKLAAEKLARARLEEEVQHLRACIDERDEKYQDDSEENMKAESVKSDSDNENDEDSCNESLENDDDSSNESLEPKFKKEDINRSQLLKRSLLNDTRLKSLNNTTQKCQDNTENEDVVSVKSDSDDEESYNESLEPSFSKQDLNRSKLLQRSLQNECKLSNASPDISFNSAKSDETFKDIDVDPDETITDNQVNESNVTSQMAAQNSNLNDTESGSKINNNDANSNAYLTSNDGVEHYVVEKKKSNHALMRGTYVVTDEPKKGLKADESKKTEDFKVPNETRTLNPTSRTGESLKDLTDSSDRKVDLAIDNLTETFTERISVNRKSVKSRLQSDVSLAQFEQLEIEAKENCSSSKRSDNIVLSDIKILNSKRNYFDDVKIKDDLIPKLKGDKRYFEDIPVKTETTKNIALVKNYLRNDERSPSIVRDEEANNFEPSTIKKLLGESFTRQDALPSDHSLVLSKKHVSMDIFECFDSPRIVKPANSPKIDEEFFFSKDALKNYKNDKSFAKETMLCDVACSSKDLTDDERFKSNGEIAYDSAIVVNVENITSNKETGFSKMSILDKCIEKEETTLKMETLKSVDELLLSQNGDEVKESNSLVSKESTGLKVNVLEEVRKSINELVQKHKENEEKVYQPLVKEENIFAKPHNVEIPIIVKKESENEIQSNSYNNTVEDFENIYKDITAPRPTEFELLVSQINTTNADETTNFEDKAKINEKPKYNLRRTKIDTSVIKTEVVNENNDKSSEKKTGAYKKNVTYNKELDKLINCFDNKANSPDEVLLESQSKCESNAKPRRTLRLRRQKNTSIEDAKLKDIVNLQVEFSDVTMDIPAPVKETKDIESPERKGEEENVPPLLSVQSCPSKSVTRSRRKLFTPRAEPLEESMAQSGESNERIRVPRPSYHRTRARRKL